MDTLTVRENEVYQTRNQSGQDPLNYPIKLNNTIAELSGVVGSGEFKPTNQSREAFTRLSRQLDAELAALKRTMDTSLPALNAILRAEHAHEKEYLVTVDRPLTDAFLAGMATGVPILDTVTNPCRVERVAKNTFRIVLTQGLNRQIRRMCKYFDYTVRRLQRVRIMHLRLGRLPVGSWRELSPVENAELAAALTEAPQSVTTSSSFRRR